MKGARKEKRSPEININDPWEIDSITESQITLINTLQRACKETDKNVVVSCVTLDYEKTGENLILIGEPYPNGKWRLWYSEGTTKTPNVDGIICDCGTKNDMYKCMQIMRGVKTKKGFDSRYDKVCKFIDTQK